MSEKVCPICKEVTNSYMGNYRKDGLCKKHAKDYKDGLIVQCLKCNLWHNADDICECEKISDQKYTELPLEGFENCVLCGEVTTGYAFCYPCYCKRSNEDLLSVLNNKNIEFKKDVKKQEFEIKEKIDHNIINKINIYENNQGDEKIENGIIIIDSENKLKCITCGKKTDGLLFCSSCYYKYKEKELLFKIKNCVNVELLEENYEGRYTCKDGHVVKSKSESLIDNYLFDHNISHAYEREISYGPSSKEVLYPDFYLPNYLGEGKHVYMEHWGYNENNLHYTKTKKFKIEIYEKKKITLVCTDEKRDMGKIDTVLDRKLNKVHIKFEIINDND